MPTKYYGLLEMEESHSKKIDSCIKLGSVLAFELVAYFPYLRFIVKSSI